MDSSPTTPSPAPSPAGSRVLLWVVAVAFFMQMLDGTILNTALPGIAAEMDVPPLRMQSVVVAYMLTVALAIPASGWLSGRFGTKRVFVGAVLAFTAGSVLCAISTTLNGLTAARVAQGVGGALMVPVGRLAVIRAFPRDQMVRVLSFITIPGLIGPLAGPVAGGFLVQYASWHWIFLINLPMGIAGALFAWRCMPADPPGTRGRGRFDGGGFLLFGGAMVAISFGMEGLGELHWPKAQATLLAGAGLCLLALYWLRAAHIAAPLFPPRLFGTPRFAVGIAGNLFARLGSGAMPFLTPLFLQLALGFSPFMAGITMIPSAAGAIVGKSVVDRLVRRLGFRTFLTANTLALGALVAAFSRVDADTPHAWLWGLLGVFGMVNSLQFTGMNTVTLIDLPDEMTGDGNGLLSVVMQVSNVCGVSMAAAVLDGFLAHYGAAPDPAATARAFAYTYLCVGGLTALTAWIFGQLPREKALPPAGAPPAEG